MLPCPTPIRLHWCPVTLSLTLTEEKEEVTLCKDLSIIDLTQSNSNEESEPIDDPTNLAGVEEPEYETKSPNNIFKCGQCHFNAEDKHKVEEHMIEHLTSSMSKIVQVQHKPSQVSSETQTNPIPNVCIVCGKKFPVSYDLETHKKENHERPSTFSCNICQLTFLEVDKLQTHIIQVHTQTVVISNENLPFHCEYCGLGFTQQSIQAHSLTEHSHEILK